MIRASLGRGLFLLVVLSATGCAAPQESEPTDTEATAITSTVEAQVALFAEGASKLDPAIQASMMAPDVQFVDFSRILTGREATVEWARQLFGNFQSFTLTWDEVAVDVLSRNVALATAIGSMRRQHVDGRIQQSDGAIYFTGLYKRTGDDWLLARGHLSGSMRTVDQP